MSKFFVKAEQIEKNNITILGQDVNHIINVLRMKKGDIIKICNKDTGGNYMSEIMEFSKDSVKCKILEEIKDTTEPNIQITLFQGVPKFEKMELIIQKNTEVGVSKIIPVIMERTIVKIDDKIAAKKIERWQKIAEIAAKQSMRDIIPTVSNIIKMKDIDKFILDYDEIIVAYENEKDNTLKNILRNLKDICKENYKIAIIIGPEGGISEKEIEILKKYGAKFVTLGKRILRTETAGLVMAGNIIYEFEE